MDSFHYGDIWLVDFEPSVGHEYQKHRPAVVVQSDQQLKHSNLITVIPLTSQVAKKLKDDIVVQKNPTNRLFVDSVLKVHSNTSFDKRRFIKKIGKMEVEIMEKIKLYLKVHFGL